MDDPILASRAAAGDLDSLGQLYDRYFAGVYDFTWRVLRDADAAAAATRETFVRASRHMAGASRAPSFKSWLFGIAFESAIGRAADGGAESPAHEEAFGTFDVPDPCRLRDKSLVGGDDELGCLVWEAATSLSARDYALLDLDRRQGLTAEELAPLLGRGAHVNAVLPRLRRAASDAIQTYVVARRGNRDCVRLAELLVGMRFPPYTDDVRHAVDDHIITCEACQRTKSLVPAPLDVLAAFVAAPAPFVLKGDVWRELVAISDGEVAPMAAAGGVVPAAAIAGDDFALPAYAGAGAAGLAAGLGTAGGGGRFDGGAPGVAAGDERPWQKPVMFAIAAVVVLLFAILGATAVASVLGGDGDDGGSAVGDETAEASPTRGTPGVSLETPTADLTPAVTATPDETETGTSVPPTNTPPPQAPTATATSIVVPASPTTAPPPPATPTRQPPILLPSRTPVPGGTPVPNTE